MPIKPGTLLISNPTLEDENFQEAVVLIASSDSNGYTGFVINQLFPGTLNQLQAFKHCKNFPFYDGGPVEREGIFFIHQRPDLIEGGVLIFDTIYLGGNFNQVIELINHDKICQKDLILFIGYCGWDEDQLEEEIKEGSWLLNHKNSSYVFTHNTTNIWKQLYDELK